jgi:hypothetical protein
MAIVAIPPLFILHHARRMFRYFKRGEVFGAAPIDHIRLTGLWLMISVPFTFVAQILLNLAVRAPDVAARTPRVYFDNNPVFLLFGLGIYVAAYVMAEARRIADENASIV